MDTYVALKDEYPIPAYPQQQQQYYALISDKCDSIVVTCRNIILFCRFILLTSSMFEILSRDPSLLFFVFFFFALAVARLNEPVVLLHF